MLKKFLLLSISIASLIVLTGCKNDCKSCCHKKEKKNETLKEETQPIINTENIVLLEEEISEEK